MKDKYRPPIIKHLIMLSVMCFVNEYKQLESWVPESMKRMMTRIALRLSEVSGFGLLFFSKSKEDKIQVYAGNMGKLWSLMVCSSIAAIIAQSVHDDFESKRLTVPTWMRSFGNLEHGTDIVEPIVHCLEKHNIVPLVKERSKRLRKSVSAVTSILETDPLRGARELATDCLRSAVLAELTDGRLRARTRMYKKLTFVLERMKSFQSCRVAREAGFDIFFERAETEEELTVPALVLHDSIWAIPKTSTGSPSDSGISAINVNLFKTHLLGKFKSMNGTITYAKEVLRTEEDKKESVDHPEVLQPSLTCRFSETINLHILASGVLVDEFGLKDLPSLLCYNALSLRVIHVTALTLRGLVGTGTGADLKPAEKCALGDVIFDPLDRSDCDNCATVALGKRADGLRKRKDSAKLIQMRDSKRYMTWSEYKTEKKERAVRALVQHGCDTSEAGTTSSGNYGATPTPPADEMNMDLSWMDGN